MTSGCLEHITEWSGIHRPLMPAIRQLCRQLRLTQCCPEWFDVTSIPIPSPVQLRRMNRASHFSTVSRPSGSPVMMCPDAEQSCGWKLMYGSWKLNKNVHRSHNKLS